MITKIAACLLTVAFFTACETTSTATKRTTLREMYVNNASASSYNLDEPMPPAEGPEDITADRPMDLERNPALVPTPLLRANATGGL